jgi:hypothetical protein
LRENIALKYVQHDESPFRPRHADSEDVFFKLTHFPPFIMKKQFSLFEIVDSEIIFCSSVTSDVFQVYAAKKFPGMVESTSLSRSLCYSYFLSPSFADIPIHPFCFFLSMNPIPFYFLVFAEQGMKIRIRKDVRLKRGKRGSDDEEPRARSSIKEYDADICGSDSGDESRMSKVRKMQF